jgi:DNA-binding transcriptional LysR family regulator
MDVELGALRELREKPAGTIRITATEYAAQAILMPAMAKIVPLYPDINVEVMIDYGLTNIVAAQYDAGIRPGELVAKDMIAVRVGPDLRMAVVGAPSYFDSRKRPRTPQDLTQHNCINLRLPTHSGSLYVWEFERHGREVNVRVEGQLVLNSAAALLQAALQGLGLTYLTEGHVQPYLESGQLVRVLADCSRDTTSTIPAAGRRRRRSRCWSTRFDIDGDDPPPFRKPSSLRLCIAFGLEKGARSG